MRSAQLPQLREAIDSRELFRWTGRVRSARGQVLSCLLPAAVGDCCQVRAGDGRAFLGEAIGFAGDQTFVVLYEHAEVHPGMAVDRLGQGLSVPVGQGLLGRILDGIGRPIDKKGPLEGCTQTPLRQQVPAALERDRIRMPLVTGLRAIDGLLTCGRGQRVAIFSGSGVGKSTLLGEIAKNALADVNVIALIGERGREVRPFLDDCLGPEGLAKSVVVVATCDQTPLTRVRAAQVALTMADHFRAGGAHVLFLCDSLTRLAMAQRELGLALGEPPSARSYTPSVFQVLANLVEAMGNAAHGSITAILTVLVEGGDLDEPVADAVRSLVDGHIVLERRLAEQNHFPAIGISRSVSRVAGDVMEPAHQTAARKVAAILGTYADAEDLIRIGAYVKGASPQVDKAIELRPRVLQFLRQGMNEKSSWADTVQGLQTLAASWPF